jgi:hypothetical protein
VIECFEGLLLILFFEGVMREEVWMVSRGISSISTSSLSDVHKSSDRKICFEALLIRIIGRGMLIVLISTDVGDDRLPPDMHGGDAVGRVSLIILSITLQQEAMAFLCIQNVQRKDEKQIYTSQTLRFCYTSNSHLDLQGGLLLVQTGCWT